jgi:hypothetical protein
LLAISKALLNEEPSMYSENNKSVAPPPEAVHDKLVAVSVVPEALVVM